MERQLSGVRIDSFLGCHLRNFTSWRLHRLVVSGCVQVDDVTADPYQRVSQGQSVRVELAEPPDKLLPAPAGEVPVVYEDPWLMVIDKPVGMVAHPVGDFGDQTLSNFLQSHLDRQTILPGLLRPGIVHRLDRMTSGLMVVVREQRTHRELSADFENGRPQKSYLALIEGSPTFETVRIDLPIGRHPDGFGVLMSAAAAARDSRPAVTEVRVVQQLRSCCLVNCRLLTGRNHQIRVHMAQIGHPVLGDEFYGPGGTIRSQPRSAENPRTEQRHALHAAELTIRHPILRRDLTFRSPPPADFWKTMLTLSDTRSVVRD